MVKFLVSIAALGLFLTGLLKAAIFWGWFSGIPSFYFATLIFISFVTVIVYAYLHNQKQSDSFTLMFLLLLVVKLLACLAYAIVIVLKDKPGAPPNIIAFLAIYVLCTVVETSFLYSRNKAGFKG